MTTPSSARPASPAAEAEIDKPVIRPAYEPFGAFRLLLAVFVITGHLFLLGPESDSIKKLGLDDTGVALFFIISGYIIFSAYEHFYRGRTLKFALNRLLRIYPLYWAVFLLTLLPAMWSGATAMQNYSAVHFFGDLAIFGRYFQVSGLPTMQQGWSLIVELQFYFAAFVFFAAGERLRFNPWLYRIVFVLCAMSHVMVWSTDSFTRFFGGLSWGPMFLLGVAAYLFKRSGFASKEQIGWIAVFFILSTHQYIQANLVHGGNFNYFGPPTLIFIAIAGFFFWLISPYRLALPKAVDSYLGDLAYPVFLTHFPIIYALSYARPFSGLVMMCVSVVLTFAMSIALLHWVEPFIDRIRDRLRGHKV